MNKKQLRRQLREARRTIRNHEQAIETVVSTAGAAVGEAIQATVSMLKGDCNHLSAPIGIVGGVDIVAPITSTRELSRLRHEVNNANEQVEAIYERLNVIVPNKGEKLSVSDALEWLESYVTTKDQHVDRLVEKGNCQEEMLQGVVNQVSMMIYNDIKPEVSEAVRVGLDDLVNKALLETLDAEVQPTDKWGKAVGSPVNVRALLQRDAEKWLMDHVDNSGRKGRDRYGDVHPRIHWLFEEALRGKKDRRGMTQLQKMVVTAVKATIGDVEAIVNTVVRDKVKEALAK